VPIICPFCGREVEKPREFIKEAIMWDWLPLVKWWAHHYGAHFPFI
jgi:hypothetical protein